MLPGLSPHLPGERDQETTARLRGRKGEGALVIEPTQHLTNQQGEMAEEGPFEVAPRKWPNLNPRGSTPGA